MSAAVEEINMDIQAAQDKNLRLLPSRASCSSMLILFAISIFGEGEEVADTTVNAFDRRADGVSALHPMA
jgi:hypothetical protein